MARKKPVVTISPLSRLLLPKPAKPPSRFARLLGKRKAASQAPGDASSDIWDTLAERVIQVAGLADLASDKDDFSVPGRSSLLVRLADNVLPLLALRKTGDDLLKLRSSWPWLLPVLALYGWRIYHKERATLMAQRQRG